jgi:2-oxoglutarate ferredoxin oxidoreductase subunit beta
MDIKEFAGGTPAWCPGCGDFAILAALKRALAELDISPSQAVVVSGIGQAGKMPHYMRVNTFNTLHGRTLPTATGIKQVNPELTVLAVSGDGDGYGEGGNHFLHALRRNLDITYIVCDNRVFGLTKGQVSPTAPLGRAGGLTPGGSQYPAFNPLTLAIAQDISFVARGSATDKEHLAELIKAAILTPGMAFIDVLQPCVSFNKINTWQWYRERVYHVEGHRPDDRERALALAESEDEAIPIGILYRSQRTSPTPKNVLTSSGKIPEKLAGIMKTYEV